MVNHPNRGRKVFDLASDFEYALILNSEHVESQGEKWQSARIVKDGPWFCCWVENEFDGDWVPDREHGTDDLGRSPSAEQIITTATCWLNLVRETPLAADWLVDGTKLDLRRYLEAGHLLHFYPRGQSDNDWCQITIGHENDEFYVEGQEAADNSIWGGRHSSPSAAMATALSELTERERKHAAAGA
jgi:hypothetical protein